VKISKQSLSACALLIFSAEAAIAQQPQQPGPGQGRGAAQPRIISPEVLLDNRVTFRLRAPNANEVVVNGNWPDGRGLKMTKDASGIWSVTTAPVLPELWTYTFSVDGVAYTGDQGGGGRAPGLLRDAASELTNAKVRSRVRELQETLSASTIALEISSRNARVAALQTLGSAARRPRPDLDERGADMADLPGGASGLLCRDHKGKNADRLVTRIYPGVVSLVAELRGADPGATWIAGT
jgi:hypothetical protein